MDIVSDFYLPHEAVILTSNRLLSQFRLSKIVPAYKTFVYAGRRLIYPWELELHLAGYCSFKCPECSYATRHTGLMIKSEWIESLFSELKDSDLRFVFMSGGGDPLMWPYWSELVRLREKYIPDIPIGLSTNLASDMKEFPVDKINKYQVHVVGYDKDSYRTATGLDVYSSVCDNIHRICNSSSEVTLKLLVNENVLNHIDYYLDFISSFDCDNVVLKLPQNFLSNLSLSTIDISSFERSIKNHKICKKFDQVIYNLQDNLFDDCTPINICNIVHSGLYCLIREDGNVYPCIASTYSNENAIGNIKDNKLIEILNRINVDSFDKNMISGKCPTKACRHYHMNKYIQLLEQGLITPNSNLGNENIPLMI